MKINNKDNFCDDEEITEDNLLDELDELESEDEKYYSEDKYDVNYNGAVIGNYYLYKNKLSDKIWWVDVNDQVGLHLFTFDKQKYYSIFPDYQSLSTEKKKIFDEENPYWADFFKSKK